MNFKKIASVGDVPLVFKRAVQPPNNSQIHTSRPMVNLDKSRTASSKSATGDGPLVHVDKVSDSEIDIKVSRPDSSQTLQPSFKGAKREKSVQNFAAMLESEHMTSEELQSYLMQIAVTIAFLHKHGIVHGDIKLENIVITDTGIAKLIDFGMAVDTDARRKSIIFNGHDKPEGGTLGYSAPEHVTPRSGINTDGSEQSQSNSTRGDKIHSLPSFGDMVTGFIDGGSSDAAAVDAWAFGVVVFTSLLGKKPWTVATQKDPSFRRYMKSGFSAEDMECVPADLRTMLTRLLNINVERRYTMENAVTCMQQVWGFEHVPDEDDAFVNPAEGNLLGDLILESGKRMLAMFYEG
ncbi:serine/threonine protein kinase [Sphaeroforma arctica JP610]|uniref:Serine/threonine protein kinase n=1 Tax=Sphaeroforma arctica JP610 TaxID=667725 RepID=A0A0L0GC12_9EUKA|nr:serine/threonine protein kinase [Sphaeroforma arctica JP610]KNC85793.1 serine/threonine protein kinase [Sphaeroforma arctica JP610]|eukprot:XP_014159695.1 serine/threonine protein kinase [Sphaeroforma arctica JP610]